MFEADSARARVPQEHLGNARLAAEQVGHLGGKLRVAVGHEHVGKLMIDQGEGPALLEIEMLAVVGRPAPCQQARLAEHAVGVRLRGRPA